MTSSMHENYITKSVGRYISNPSLYYEKISYNTIHSRQVLKFKKNLGGQLLSHFLILVLVPIIHLKHTWHLTLNTSIRNILPIVYSKNYDPKGVSRSSNPRTPNLRLWTVLKLINTSSLIR